LRTWETGTGQLGLYAQTTSDSRLEGPSLDHHVQTAQQLDPDDLGKVPGAEEHVFGRRIQVTQTPVREGRIVQHTEQYYGSGNVLLWPRSALAVRTVRRSCYSGGGQARIAFEGHLRTR
jgi:hypothetical protein